MKLCAPPKLGGSFSHRGRLIVVGEDGTIEASEFDAATLFAHGFRPISKAMKAEPLATATRADLAACALARTRQALAELSTEELRTRLAALGSKPAPALPDESHGAGIASDPEAIEEGDVAAMNRIELFAFLRARGAPAAPPIRNEELRARARALLLRSGEG